jgi:hypothetical protein
MLQLSELKKAARQEITFFCQQRDTLSKAYSKHPFLGELEKEKKTTAFCFWQKFKDCGSVISAKTMINECPLDELYYRLLIQWHTIFKFNISKKPDLPTIEETYEYKLS